MKAKRQKNIQRQTDQHRNTRVRYLLIELQKSGYEIVPTPGLGLLIRPKAA